jgi:hypothetical protein
MGARIRRWLRPKPVPLLTPLVVKNGSNARSSVRASMPVPVPVPETEIMTYCPAFTGSASFRVEMGVRGFNRRLAAVRHCIARVQHKIEQGVFQAIEPASGTVVMGFPDSAVPLDAREVREPSTPPPYSSF